VSLRVSLVLLLLVIACATSPTGRSQLKLYSSAQLDQMGVASFQQMKREVPVSRERATSAYVVCVSDAILARLEPPMRATASAPGARSEATRASGSGEPSAVDGWEVVVFEDDSANAFALPGRKIGVHTGLLKVATNQDQLAAVIGHEVGHVLADHANERMSQGTAAQLGLATAAILTDASTPEGQATLAALGLGAQVGILLPYSRAHETEADVIGLDLMAEAGFDPAQAVDLWLNMSKAGGGQPPELLSTHPSHGTRIAELKKRVPQARELQRAARAAGRRPNCKRP
jgi:predicted Zn-dependent protease